MIPENKIQVMLAALRASIASGDISKAQAKRIRGEVGIPKSYFTKKRLTAVQRKAKRARAKAARKAQR